MACYTLLYVINAFVPMDAKVKMILNVVVVLVVVLWLLRAFGLLARLDAVTTPTTTRNTMSVRSDMG